MGNSGNCQTFDQNGDFGTLRATKDATLRRLVASIWLTKVFLLRISSRLTRPARRDSHPDGCVHTRARRSTKPRRKWAGGYIIVAGRRWTD